VNTAHPAADSGATRDVTTPVSPNGIGPLAYSARQVPSISASAGACSARHTIDNSWGVRVIETLIEPFWWPAGIGSCLGTRQHADQRRGEGDAKGVVQLQVQDA
jgi:hypothetical protein